MTLYAIIIISSILMMGYIGLIIFQIIYTYTQTNASENRGKSIGVSIVVPFKNEVTEIGGLINDLENLIGNEDNFEVIFVDDHSDDGSVSLVNSIVSGRIKLVNSPGNGKKAALKIGVRRSAYDIVATLDADVRLSDNWLVEVRKFFYGKDNGFLILPILTIAENNLAGHYEALDVLALAGTTLSWANVNNAIMCNGANMAFTKSLFNHFRSDERDGNLVSGDDVFFLHQVKAKSDVNIGAVFNDNTEAHTTSFNSFKDLLNQRARWTSKSHHYNDRTTWFVAWLVLLANVLIPLLALLSLLENKLINLFLIVFATKFIIDFIYLLLLSIKFKKSKSLVYYPLAVIIQFVFVPLVFVKSKWGNFEWKGKSYSK
ncbi:MAG: biofilm PGA synthesis N-glycosyltransferase PgaC [Flavobacteriales bacterium]|jgi:biofilm PGA synthesis N-glycosyltransferase PgaC